MSQSLKDQGKSRTQEMGTLQAIGLWSQSLKDQGKSRTITTANMAVVASRNPLKIRASLGLNS